MAKIGGAAEASGVAEIAAAVSSKQRPLKREATAPIGEAADKIARQCCVATRASACARQAAPANDKLARLMPRLSRSP